MKWTSSSQPKQPRTQNKTNHNRIIKQNKDEPLKALISPIWLRIWSLRAKSSSFGMFESPSKLLNTLNFWGTAFATSPALYWASNPACFFTVLLAFRAYISYTFAIAAFDVPTIGVWCEAKKNPVMGAVWKNGCEARSSPLSLISCSFAIFVLPSYINLVSEWRSIQDLLWVCVVAIPPPLFAILVDASPLPTPTIHHRHRITSPCKSLILTLQGSK